MTSLRGEDGDGKVNGAASAGDSAVDGGWTGARGARRPSDDELRWAGLAADVMPAATDDFDAPESDLAGGLVAPFGGNEESVRVAGARRALDDALTAWWRDGIMPDPALLRDGLLLLNAGHRVDDAQRAMLLRAALYYRRGILTALSHQVDAERTGLILHDAIVDPDHPFPAQELARLTAEDPSYDIWEPYLHAELLATARAYAPVRRRYAEQGLAVLDGKSWTLDEDGVDDGELLAADALGVLDVEKRRPRWPLVAAILLALVLAAAAVMLQGYERRRIGGMIEAPGGSYQLSNGDGTVRTVTVTPFLLDPLEVTNAQYRRCVNRGACPQPAQSHSATRANYYDDPVFGDYPVIFVDHAAANQFCAWAGKRLPSADAWQLAASLAPATQRTYSFPWGDRYLTGTANDVNAAHGDTLAVGSFRPAGNSPLGFSDMAGNVAEWTATAAPGAIGGFQVRGGSYVDGADRLRTAASVALAGDVATEWLGFRCAATSLRQILSGRFQPTISPVEAK